MIPVNINPTAYAPCLLLSVARFHGLGWIGLARLFFLYQVKPFDSGDARKILEQQLGRPLGEIFLDADTAFEVPVAAASLGQVRGTIPCVA